MVQIVKRLGFPALALAVMFVAACSSSAHNPVAASTTTQLRADDSDEDGGTPTPSPNPVTITTTSLPDGNVGTSYGAFITSSGGKTPHTFKVIAGRLPAGLSMASSFGVQSTSISGTPTTVETTTFTVEVRDALGSTATKTLSIVINPPRPLVITNQSSTLPPGTVGSSYAAQLFADGGVQPYRWGIIGGALPPGISLSQSGSLSGTPTTRGTFTFTAQVTDNVGSTASQAFSITVS